MKIHILGIGGKLMGGLALMAHQLGYQVSGSDANLQSSMLAPLKALNIDLFEGYSPEYLSHKPDLVIVGNVMSRGNPLVEAMLNQNLHYCSAPEWLAQAVLKDKWVIAVAGTHGKTTTSSMITWILTYCQYNPSYLIGGQPHGFERSSELTDSPFFVIEADEYDSAFFDKRPKFIHYHPRTLVLNNLEYDHADIYPDLDAIVQQCHYLVRTVPGEGKIIVPEGDANIEAVMAKGVWTPQECFGRQGAWSYQTVASDLSQFELYHQGVLQGVIDWSLLGEHNAMNALAAVAAAHHVGVRVEHAIEALNQFQGVQRRMQLLGDINGAQVFDDFAHHPTAVKTTLAGLRQKIGTSGRIFVILEFGSYTMRHGEHRDRFPSSLVDADHVMLLAANCDWDVAALAEQISAPHEVHQQLAPMAQSLSAQLIPGDQVVIMTNQDSAAISKAIGITV